MGLFNFNKKKDISPANQPPQPITPQPAEKKEEIDFDKLMAEMPEVPPELTNDSNSFLQGAKTGSQQSYQSKPGERQSSGKTSLSEQMNQAPGPLPPMQETEPQTPLTLGGFELPDFDDEEMRRREEARLEEARVMEEKAEQVRIQEAKLQELKLAEKKPEPKPEMPKQEPKPEPPAQIIYPEPVRQFVMAKEKFMDISTYLSTKEDFESIRKTANITEDAIEQHAIMSKAKNDKYQALRESLNTIQDQLILIDTKIFESNNES